MSAYFSLGAKYADRPRSTVNSRLLISSLLSILQAIPDALMERYID